MKRRYVIVAMIMMAAMLLVGCRANKNAMLTAEKGTVQAVITELANTTVPEETVTTSKIVVTSEPENTTEEVATTTTTEVAITTLTTTSYEDADLDDSEDLDSLPLYTGIGGCDLEGEENYQELYKPNPGDGWMKFAQNVNWSLDDVLLVNHASLEDTFYVDKMYIIPTDELIAAAKQIQLSQGKTHTLVYGETWTGICNLHKISLADFYEINNLEPHEWGKVGQEYLLPDYAYMPEENSEQVSGSSQSGKLLGQITLWNYPSGNSWYNIKRSASCINGMTLAPGQEFNWFKTPGLGPCGYAEGYLESTAYNGNEVVKAPGGGVCFTSTVLFQCARASGMNILEHWDHSRPVKYAARGDEAAINWGSKNNRFSNPTNNTVIFYAQADDTTGALTISCYIK